MCRVAYCPQSRLFDPISGRFTPIRAANPRSDAEGATHSLIPKKPVTQHPPGKYSPSPRPTLDDARTSGHRHFPGGSCLRLTTELAKMERGPIARSGPILSVWHQTGRSVRQNPAFPRARHPGYGPWGRARTGAWLRTNWRAPTFFVLERKQAHLGLASHWVD